MPRCVYCSEVYGKEEGSVGSKGFVCSGCYDDSEDEEGQAEEESICPECGSFIDTGGRYTVCNECGYKLGGRSGPEHHKFN